jgi:hypothetical protein
MQSSAVATSSITARAWRLLNRASLIAFNKEMPLWTAKDAEDVAKRLRLIEGFNPAVILTQPIAIPALESNRCNSGPATASSGKQQTYALGLV